VRSSSKAARSALERVRAARVSHWSAARARVSSSELGLESAHGTLAWLLVSSELDFVESGGRRTEGVFLLDRSGLQNGAPRALAGGRARWSVEPEPGAGVVYVQALVLDLAAGRWIFSGVQRLARVQ
jgi:hypothetical protein